MAYRKVNGKENKPGDSAYGEAGKSGLPFFLHRRIAGVCCANGRNERPSNGKLVSRFVGNNGIRHMLMNPKSQIQSPKNRVNISGSPRSNHTSENRIHHVVMISFLSRSRIDQIARKVEDLESSERTENDGKDTFDWALAKLKARSWTCLN